MIITADGSVDMLIVDSMGADTNGYYGWVNSDDYFASITSLYGVIPTK